MSPKENINPQTFRNSCAALLLVTSLVALYTCPHSKVEESFNLQASHDLYYYGLGPAWRSFIAQGGFNKLKLSPITLTQSCVAEGGVDFNGGTCAGGGDALPYDHVMFPGGEFLSCI